MCWHNRAQWRPRKTALTLYLFFKSDERAALIKTRLTLEGALKCAFLDLRLELLTPENGNQEDHATGHDSIPSQRHVSQIPNHFTLFQSNLRESAADCLNNQSISADRLKTPKEYNAERTELMDEHERELSSTYLDCTSWQQICLSPAPAELKGRRRSGCDCVLRWDGRGAHIHEALQSSKEQLSKKTKTGSVVRWTMIDVQGRPPSHH